MTDALSRFPPTRLAALERLQRFVPLAGRSYAARRNYDLGRDGHTGVSTLSPYLRARLITEDEVLQAVLGRHSASAAEKFIQEVYWRTYWKGWLELRPTVWDQYQSALTAQIHSIQSQSGLRQRWEAACTGQTDIACFNAWAQELVETGYLHNHARMWFASIWIFTLRLPWELGADFFLRHLLDGDPASNTLGWRWVAGIQTPGKTYLARASNISKFTEGRFAPEGRLALAAPPLDGLRVPDRRTLPDMPVLQPGLRTGLLLHDDDLSPGFLFETGMEPVATALVRTRNALTPLEMAPHVDAFARAATEDMRGRHAGRLENATWVEASAEAFLDWAETHSLEQVVTPYAPVGPNADLIRQLSKHENGPLIAPVRRASDSAAWPHATHGFFRFKENIPALLGKLHGLGPVS